MIQLFSRIRWEKKSFVWMFLFLAASSVAEMLLPTGVASMIDVGVGTQNPSIIMRIALLMVIFCVISMLATAMSTALSAKLSVNFAAQIREQIFNKVQNFSAAEIDKFGTASLVTRSTSDVANIQSFLSMLLRMGLSAPLVAVAGLAFSAATGGSVSAVLTVSIPVLLIALAIIAVFMLRYSAILRTKVDGLNHLFLEAMEGVRVIRAFNKQGYEKERFAKANQDYVKIAVRSGRFSGLLMPAVNLIFGLTTAAMMALGAILVYQGEMEVGALIANTQYVSMILSAVIMLAVVVVMYPNAAACAKRINEVLQTEISITNPENPVAETDLTGTIEFKNVTFSYPGADAPVLKDISFVSKPGEFTAIIGGTGCGKSSIIKLIPRLYDTMFGEVLVNGVNVKKYNLKALRDKIGYVQQKNILFSGTISDNLCFGRENASEEEQRYAAEIASAAEFIEKRPESYQSRIAQGGTNVSGGQKQRLAIARALIKKPEIYLFDDSFSALDVKTDRELRAKLRKETRNATVVMVAQRVSSIMDADRILVLDAGRIVGQGTHKELLQSCPLYREIAELQMGKEALGA